MDSVGAIILAAGLSRRMRDRNKLLLPIAGTPMIRHVVQTYLAAISGEVCVVTGFEPARIKAALAGLPIRLIHNPEFEKGQAFSVKAGLLEAPLTDHLLIGLGDQPELTADDLRAFIRAHLEANPAKISIPLRDATRGNPIVVPAHMRARLLADDVNPGCGKFTRTNPDLSAYIPMPTPGFFSDIDTPDAFAAFERMTPQGATT
ncbi:NTP transferase domain-containing protein [Sulfitobacter sp. HGT1]|uniref:nucleotidyltransferase family protein n=1 Tax=Sulfitobacter sp. HGT1 TaxID=2735435 RepID=UPI001593F63B|nr:nucleotidyltransferase family protein [Sulfitobacter sp. HGT1]